MLLVKLKTHFSRLLKNLIWQKENTRVINYFTTFFINYEYGEQLMINKKVILIINPNKIIRTCYTNNLEKNIKKQLYSQQMIRE